MKLEISKLSCSTRGKDRVLTYISDINITKNCCLVVVDLQKDFLDKKGHYSLKNADITLMRSAKKAIEKILVKTHKKIPVIFIKSEYTYEKFGKGKSICVAGTEGAEFLLNKQLSNKTIIKNKH